MKKTAILGLLAIVLISYGSVTMAVDDVTNTDHNLSNRTNALTAAGNTQICVYCHTPHNASVDNTTALWNRADISTTNYTMYSSPTLDMTVAASPAGVSLACLSCHDGGLATDSLLNNPVANGTDFLGNSLGTDLSNDHPVSLTYDATQDPTGFHAAVNNQVNGLQLFGATGDQVECGTCHSVHDDTNGSFLRMSNAGSALCLACHVK